MNIFDIKQNNRNKIYSYIRNKQVATKQEIAYALKLSLPTVSKNLEYLQEQGLIRSDSKVATKTGGRNPIAYSYTADARVAIGLDITKHHIKSVILDLQGTVLKYIYKRRDYRRDESYLKLLGEMVETTIDSVQLDRAKILGVGICVPGIIDHDRGCVVQGRVIDNEGMDCEEFARYIPYPAKLIHDSYASGFSEIWMSSDIRSAFYISLCASVGGSILMNGKVYMGDGLYSGEIGHINLVPGGKQCYCGQKGCLDSYCNTEVLSRHTDCDLGLFFCQLQEGDEQMQTLWDEYLNHLAAAINDIRVMFGSTVIIGGYIGAYIRDYMDVLCQKVDVINPFGEAASSYLIPCKNELESVATGGALFFVEDFLKNI
ncbi:MAG: ROK family protein [Lachnospiraceae bacterium]